MISPETMKEAIKWYNALETTDNLDRIWPQFDDWFQASEAHRRAYKAVRQYREQIGLPFNPRWARSSTLKLNVQKIDSWATWDRLERYALLISLAAVLILTIGAVAHALRVPASCTIRGPFSLLHAELGRSRSVTGP